MTVSRGYDHRTSDAGHAGPPAGARHDRHNPGEAPVALPPAFADGGAPYSLEELLSGLPPLDDSGALHDGSAEALLLSEVETPTATEAQAWTDEVEQAAPPEDAAGVADPADSDEPYLLTEVADEFEPAAANAAMDATVAPPPPEPADQESGALAMTMGELADALRELTATDALDGAPQDDAPQDDESEDNAALASLVAVLQETAAHAIATSDPAEPPPAPAAPDNRDDSDDATTQDVAKLVAALQQAEEVAEDEDVLVLDDALIAPSAQDCGPAGESEGEWDASALRQGNLVGALRGLAEEAPPPAPAEPATAEQAGEPAPPEQPEAPPASESTPATDAGAAEPADDDTADEAQALSATIEAIIAAHCPPGEPMQFRGDPALPERLDALAALLADPPPPQDFVALDALYACWSKNTHDSSSRALLAVAQNLSRNFGLPGKLPMASSKAWRMLSPLMFEHELAQRLADIGTFIADWQKTQRTFLILEFGEIELIEYLFEALHPGYHADLLAGVMNFKVLSNRRMGLLRRIPNRLKRQVTPLLPDNKEAALILLAHSKALLERIAEPTGFAPIVDTASKMLEEIQKMMKAVANIGAPPPVPPPGGGGIPLGRIG